MSRSKPRIAFCFSGQARTLDYSYVFFQRNLFDAAKGQGFDYDIFCVVEDDEDVDKVNLLNPTKVEKIKSSDIEKIIEKKYGDFIGTAFKTKYKWARYTSGTVVRFLQQLYKVCRSIKICDNIENYDIIIRLRFDTIFINQLNFNQILKNLNNKNIIICGDSDLKQKGILGKILYPTREILDFYFFGNERSMKIISDAFDNFEQCFMGNEIKLIFKPIYTLSNLISKLLIIINNRTKVNIPLLPIEIGIYKIFVPEKAYYQYFLYNNIDVIKTNISLLIIRKYTNLIRIVLNDKSQYEI